jgi:hypothetical protein
MNIHDTIGTILILFGFYELVMANSNYSRRAYGVGLLLMAGQVWTHQ